MKHQVLTKDGVTVVCTGQGGSYIKVFRPRLFPGEPERDVEFYLTSSDCTQKVKLVVHCDAVPT